MNEPSQKTTDLSALSDVTSDPAPTPAGGAARPAAASEERYRLLDEIAHGGMGVIYRAYDTALNREVAVKVLQDKFAPDSAVSRRFANEARIAAQLQHPAIPPVHDLATLPDGRPFLAMKLIKGRTLADLLDARSDAASERGAARAGGGRCGSIDEARPGPQFGGGRRQPERPELLGRLCGRSVQHRPPPEPSRPVRHCGGLVATGCRPPGATAEAETRPSLSFGLHLRPACRGRCRYIKQIRANTDLKALHARADFQKLLKELEAKSVAAGHTNKEKTPQAEKK